MKRQLLVLSLLTTLAVAQPDEPVLSGPVIQDRHADHATLVRWAYDGRLERLDTTPEQAAVDLLELDPTRRETVDTILARRMAAFDKAVIESLDLVIRFQSAQALKDYPAMASLIGQFMGRLAELLKEGPASLQIAAALPAPEAKHFKALVEEYNRATLADEKRQAQREGRKFKPVEALLKARGEELGREIERAVRRSAAMGEAGFEIFLQAMELDPEVEAVIRARTIDFARAHNFTPSKQAQDTFFSELFIDLDRESRVKVMTGLLRYQSRGLDYGYGKPMAETPPMSDHD